MRNWALLLLLGWALAARLSADEANLVVNPGFEVVREGKPEGWRGGGKASHSLDAAKARTGKGAVRVRFADRFGQGVPAQPNRYYILTGYVRREDPKGSEIPKVKIYFIDKGGKRRGGVAKEFGDVAMAYVPFRLSFVPPNGTATIGVSLCGEFHGSEWFWYDDLCLTAKPCRDMPRAEKTPSLHGKTVRVADIADCRSFALLRVPPHSLLPIDGRVGTQCSTRRAKYVRHPPEVCNFDMCLQNRRPVSHLLVHCPSPLFPIRSAQVDTREGETLAQIRNTEETVLPVALRRVETDRLRLAVRTKPEGEAHVGEIQLFDIQDGLPSALLQPYRLMSGDTPKDYASAVARAFPRGEDRQVLLAQTGGLSGKPAVRRLNAGCYQSILLPPVKEAQGVRGFQLELDMESPSQANVLEIALRRCRLLDRNLKRLVVSDRRLAEKVIRANPQYNLAERFRIYTTLFPGRAPLRIHFNVPTMLLEEGERLWLSIRPLEDATLHLPQSRIGLVAIDGGLAEREVLPRLLRFTRRLYSIETEAHPYDGLPCQEMHLYRLVERVLKTDPESRPANDILRRIAKRKLDVTLQRPGPADAPDWAVWGRKALQNAVEILTWWIDHQQVENGELGGHFNDDTEFSCKWPPFCLITGDEKLSMGLQKIADGCWEYMGERGYSISIMDVEHAAEDAQCSQPQMITVRYGDPEYLERLMLWSSYLPKWTAINRNGDRLFRSYMFNARQVSKKPKQDIDHAYCAQAMAGPYTLAWYADTEIPRAWFLEWARSWVKASMSTAKGKPAGAIPCDLLFETGEIAPYTDAWNKSVYYSFGQYTMRNAFIAGYLLSLDPYYLAPFGVDWRNVRGRAAGAAWRKLSRDTRHDEYFLNAAKQQLAGYAQDGPWRWPPELMPYLAWLVSGDKAYLVEQLKETCREYVRHRRLLTEAEPATDRVPFPGRRIVPFMYLGGCAGGMKATFPYLALSWEGGGTDFAALVLENDVKHLKALVYSFAPKPIRLTARVWELEHGEYDIAFGPDTNRDDRMDDKVLDTRRILRRHDPIALSVSPGMVHVLEIKQREKLDPILGRPDLAISPRDVTLDHEGRSVEVILHNVGASDARDIPIVARDERGAEIGRAQLDVLPAPKAAQAVRAKVRVPLEHAVPHVTVEIDPEDEIPEIAESNNRATAQR